MDSNIIKILLDNPKELRYVSNDLKDNYDVVFELVKLDGTCLKFASDRLQSNKEIALAAINQNIDATKYISESLKSDFDVVYKALSIDFIGALIHLKTLNVNFSEEQLIQIMKLDILAPRLILRIPQICKNNKKFIIKIIKEVDNSYKYLEQDTKDDFDILIEAIKKDYRNLSYVSYEILENKEIFIRCLHINPLCHEYIATKLLNDKDVIKEMINHGYTYIIDKCPKHILSDYDKRFLFKLLLNNIISLDMFIYDIMPFSKITQDEFNIIKGILENTNIDSFKLSDDILQNIDLFMSKNKIILKNILHNIKIYKDNQFFIDYIYNNEDTLLYLESHGIKLLFMSEINIDNEFDEEAIKESFINLYKNMIVIFIK